MDHFEFSGELLAKFDRIANVVQKISHQFMEDPCASLVYFRHCYIHEKLEKQYCNPPINWDFELGV